MTRPLTDSDSFIFGCALIASGLAKDWTAAIVVFVLLVLIRAWEPKP